MKNNHSKVKARDIIAGWPKGRSTSFWNPFDCQLFFISFMYNDEELDEMEATREYHLEQQRMVDKFIEMGKPVPVTKLDQWKWLLDNDYLDYDIPEHREELTRRYERGARMK